MSRNAHHFQFSPKLELRIYSVNILAELVEVDAAHMDIPISHHGIERPERKKSVAFFDAQREHHAAIPNITRKNTIMTVQSIKFKSIVLLLNYFEYFFTVATIVAFSLTA